MRIFQILNRIYDVVFMIICIFILCLGLYSIADTVLVYNHASDASLLKYKPGTSKKGAPAETLTGNIAWLTIDGTNIDYPVMQGKDNSEYLNKDPYGNYSLSGSIFLDCHNKPDFTDSYNLVYGHHMEADKMFGQLDKYQDKLFFEKHRTGSLTVGNTYYKIGIFAVVKTTAEDHVIFDVSDTSADKVAADAKERAVNFEDTDGPDHLIALSTCKDTDSTDRTVVIGKLKVSEMPKTAKQGTKKVKWTGIQKRTSILGWLILGGIAALIIFLFRKRKAKESDNAD